MKNRVLVTILALLISVCLSIQPESPIIEVEVGYPKLLVGNEYYYLIEVDSSRIIMPEFEQVTLNNKTYYLIDIPK